MEWDLWGVMIVVMIVAFWLLLAVAVVFSVRFVWRRRNGGAP